MSVQLPPNSTGSVVDTISGTGGHERQVVACGDPAAVANVTYRAAGKAVNIGTSATTNIWKLIGSATKTVKVLRVTVSGTILTTAETYDVQLNKQSADDTGGTAVAETAVPLDSSDAAATAVPSHYTAAPTAGAVVGIVGSTKLQAIVAPGEAVTKVWEFGTRPGGKPLILRGVAQVLAMTLNGATPGHTPSFDFEVEWTEE